MCNRQLQPHYDVKKLLLAAAVALAAIPGYAAATGAHGRLELASKGQSADEAPSTARSGRHGTLMAGGWTREQMLGEAPSIIPLPGEDAVDDLASCFAKKSTTADHRAMARSAYVALTGEPALRGLVQVPDSSIQRVGAEYTVAIAGLTKLCEREVTLALKLFGRAGVERAIDQFSERVMIAMVRAIFHVPR